MLASLHAAYLQTGYQCCAAMMANRHPDADVGAASHATMCSKKRQTVLGGPVFASKSNSAVSDAMRGSSSARQPCSQSKGKRTCKGNAKIEG